MSQINDRSSYTDHRRVLLTGLLGLPIAAAAAETAHAGTGARKDGIASDATIAADIALITNVINLYALAVDSQQWGLFDRVFTPDVYAAYGTIEPYTQIYTDLAQYKAGFADIHAPLERSQHRVMGHVVNPVGDTAQAFSNVSYRLTRKDQDGEKSSEGAAFYDDQLVRTKAGWLIKRRIARVVWKGGGSITTGNVSPLAALKREGAAGKVAIISALLHM